MKRLENWLSELCSATGVCIDIAYLWKTKKGEEILTVARIRNIGGENGILIFNEYIDVNSYVKEIIY